MFNHLKTLAKKSAQLFERSDSTLDECTLLPSAPEPQDYSATEHEAPTLKTSNLSHLSAEQLQDLFIYKRRPAHGALPVLRQDV